MSPINPQSNLRLNVFLALSISLLSALGIWFFSTRSLNNLQETKALVDHTNQVIDTGDELVNALSRIESSARGYVLTGKEMYITSFESDSIRVKKSLSNLGRLLNENETQLLSFNTLRINVEKKLDHSSILIQLRQKDPVLAIDRVNTSVGKYFMDTIYQIVDSIVLGEKEALQKQSALAENQAEQIRLFNLIGIFVTICIALGMGYLIFKEVNRREKLEQFLKEEENRIRQLFVHIPVGVIILRRDGVISLINEEAQKILGKGIPERKTPISAYFGFKTYKKNEPYPDARLPINQALIGNVFKTDDIEVVVNGQAKLLSMTARPIYDGKGNIDFAIGVFSDVLEAKELEEQLREAKLIAETTASMKENFLANMSHEIRTPMNAIMGFTGLLEKSSLNKTQLEYVDAIKSSGQNLLTIINDILDLSKIEAGMMALEKIPFSIRALMESIYVLLRQKADEKRVQLTFDIAETIPEVFKGDPVRLTQILVNLINNAIKFTEKGGVKIKVSAVPSSDDFYEIRFDIEDSGIGMSNEQLESVFERFNQATTSTTRKYGGTGLGLNIVKNLVDLHHGIIEVQSELGKGTLISIVLFYEKAEEYAAAAIIEKGDKLQSLGALHMKVLVAEDNVMNQKLVKAVLNSFGIKHDIANNGKEAVEMLQKDNYELILMDIQMPELDGYEATRIIRQELKSEIPIVAMTAHAMSGEKEKCIQSGMNDYLSKPFRSDDLYMTIYKLLVHKLEELHLEKFETTPIPSNSEPVLNTRLYDFSYLKELSGGDQEFMNEMIDVFKMQVPQEVSLLQTHYQDEDYQALRLVAHKLKSSYKMIGAHDIAKDLEFIEQSAVSLRQHSSIADAITRIEALHTALIQQLEEI